MGHAAGKNQLEMLVGQDKGWSQELDFINFNIEKTHLCLLFINYLTDYHEALRNGDHGGSFKC